MTAQSILDDFERQSDPKWLREQASRADARAWAAERDGDIGDACKWKGRATEYRRRARSLEFKDDLDA